MKNDLATKLQTLLEIFDAHYVCSHCQMWSASYLETCQNPLHELHKALFQLLEEK
jgi:hypothetical protein